MSSNDAHPVESHHLNSSGDVEAAPDPLAESSLAATVEEPDEPVHPDEATRAEIEAARGALLPRAPRRRYKGPRSIAILIVVVAMVVTVGIYAMQWALRLRDSDDKAELKKLEERQVMSGWQQKWVAYQTPLQRAVQEDPTLVVKPRGYIYEPLNEQEKARLDELLSKFPSQFQPDERQKKMIEEIRQTLPAAPASAPAKSS